MHILFASMIVLVQLLSRVWLFVTPRTAARQVSLPFTVSWSLFKLMSVQLVIPSNYFILCGLLLLLPSSQHQGLFQWVCSSPQVAKVLELQHQWIFQWIFRVDFFWDWLVWSPCCPRETQESFFQQHRLKASVLSSSAFLRSNSQICTKLLDKQ